MGLANYFSSTLMTIFPMNSNKYNFKRKILDKSHNTIKGMIKIISYDISKDLNDINSYSERVLFIDERFKVN